MANRQVCGILGRQLRSFSSTPSNAAAVALPIQLYGLEGRYATAIYTAAVKKNQLTAVEKDFQGITETFAKEKRLNDILKNPLLTKEQRQNAVNELAVKKNANALTVNTLTLLAENGRLGRLQGVAKAFATIMSAHKGEINAKVTTAKQLDATELKDLQAVLKTFVKSGNTLKLETKVDPTLIGGMVVELGDRYIDLSISSRLRTYEAIVKETL
jgi:F-type H+-transporting ATPase subunit O